MQQLELNNIINHKLDNWQINIKPCEGENPREFCNIGRLFLPDHCRYASNESELDFDDFTTGNLQKDIKKLDKMGFFALPVSVYDHSGVKVYIGGPCDRWDSGVIGFYLIDKKEVKKDYGWKRINKKHLEELANAELEEYTAYYNGQVYYYELTRNDEELDACGGFYGLDCFKYMFDNMPQEFTQLFTLKEAESLATWEY